MIQLLLFVFTGIGIVTYFFYQAAVLLSNGNEQVRAFVIWISFGTIVLLAVAIPFVGGMDSVATTESTLTTGPLGDLWLLFAILTLGVLLFAVGTRYAKLQAKKKEVIRLHQEVALVRAEIKRYEEDSSVTSGAVQSPNGPPQLGEFNQERTQVVSTSGESPDNRPNED